MTCPECDGRKILLLFIVASLLIWTWFATTFIQNAASLGERDKIIAECAGKISECNMLISKARAGCGASKYGYTPIEPFSKVLNGTD